VAQKSQDTRFFNNNTRWRKSHMTVDVLTTILDGTKYLHT